MQLLGAVLARVDVLSRQAETTTTAEAAVVGDLCFTLRAYCVLAALGRPALRPQHVRAFITVPQCAFRALLASYPSSSPPPVDNDDAAGNAVPAAVSRLEEVLLCAIVVTAGRLGVPITANENVRSDGRGGQQHSRIFEAEEDTLSSAVAAGERGKGKGAELEDGMRLCGMALGDLVKLSRSVNGGCYAALYGTMLLRGARLEALMEVVGDVLGVSVGLPLFSLEGVGESVLWVGAPFAYLWSDRLPCAPGNHSNINNTSMLGNN